MSLGRATMAPVVADLTSLSIQRSLKEEVINNFSSPYGQEGNLQTRKLNMNIKDRNTEKRVQLLSLGEPTMKPTKVILLMGATGTGKTTLINNMVNFIYRVEFTDDFRLILIDDKNASKCSQAESQTNMISAYVFYNLQGMPFDYNYVLIDTPGFGDTTGIEQDRLLMLQLNDFLKQNYNIDHVDSIGFVTPSSAVRLTHTQRYVYDGLSSMFGKDVKDNIYILATFADARTPPIRDGLKAANIKYSGLYKFNNSALYASNKGNGSESESESDDEENSYLINKTFWEMGYNSMNNFFKKLGKTLPVSLTLTKEVLEERNKLQITAIGLQNQIHIGLSVLANLNKERSMLARLGDDMQGCANYKEEIQVPRIREINLQKGEHVTNCLTCNMTCHYPCYIPEDKNKSHCRAMKDMYCQACPQKCFWNIHRNNTFRYETSWHTEERTVQELLDRYNNAQQGMLDKQALVKAIEEDINKLSELLIDKIKTAQKCVDRLEEIALKPNPLATHEYIDLLIESEKNEKRHNFQDRIAMLQKLKEEVAVLQGVRSNVSSKSGEALLQFFQKLMAKLNS
ncbi:hypothetical protein Pcinc_033475 [Petrolisthes cinctipes]|uniref:G domain-containing protein n=1 Tax=Petrolisthes cinctipes TaxID=88211 RepID=A0AAE1JZ87_PETCI|nr:hypothetical protein Pcinc_033475 [Petrolisthes cinctipes]